MLVIPAIDLKDGKCVRLRQGRKEEETVFSDDPLAVADRWVEAGARRLHIVDLNGAFTGRPVKAPLRSTMCSRRAPASTQRSATAKGSSEKTVSSSLRPWRRRTHLPSLRSMAGMTSMALARPPLLLARLPQAGSQPAKLASRRSPARWLFSGWNCTANRLPRATAQGKRSPYSQVAATSSPRVGRAW